MVEPRCDFLWMPARSGSSYGNSETVPDVCAKVAREFIVGATVQKRNDVVLVRVDQEHVVRQVALANPYQPSM